MNFLNKSKFINAITVLVMVTIQSCSEAPPKEVVIKKVKAIQIGEMSSLEQRAFPGKAQAVEEASMSFRVSGQLSTRPVNVGDVVKKGTLLATVDDVDFQNAVRIAEGTVAEAEAAYEDAARNYQRTLDIQKKDPGVISQVMIDRAKANDSITRAALSSANAALKLSQDRLSYTRLVAPFDGEVVATYVEAHETIIAKQNIIRVVNRNAMEFEFDVPESLIGYANAVTQARVVFDINQQTEIAATVKEIGREASQSTRTYPVTLLIENTDEFEILPGMAGKAYIKANVGTDSALSGLDIPATALFSHGELDNSFVWVVVDEKVQERKVTVLRASDYGIKISAGLKQGEWVVVAGVHSLIEGQQVRIMDASEHKE